MKRTTRGMLNRRLLPAAGAVLVFLSAASISAAGVSECHDATCRISAGNAKGTGCVFEIGRGYVFVLSNAHVVGSASTVECEFWRHGHRSRPVAGRVIMRGAAVDAAVIAVAQTAFGAILPAAVPLAGRDTMLRPGETVISVGCPHGSWATAWKGHVLGYHGDDLRFLPAPANGRSGSAIFDATGRQIVGLLRARTGDQRQGIAVSVQGLYRAFSNKAESGERRAGSGGWRAGRGGIDAQCPGGVCPPGSCFPFGQRSQPDRRPESSPWPTLPPPAAGRAEPVDLAPLASRLDKITELLIEMKNRDRPAEQGDKTPAAAPAHQPAQKAIEEVQQESGRLREAIGALVGDHQTLKERFEARVAKVREELGEDSGRREIARAYVKDLAKEKLAEGTLGLTGGKLLGAALGVSGPLSFALGMGLWLVSRRIGAKVEAGEPLLAQRIFDRLGEKIDEIKNRLGQLDIRETPSQRKK